MRSDARKRDRGAASVSRRYDRTGAMFQRDSVTRSPADEDSIAAHRESDEFKYEDVSCEVESYDQTVAMPRPRRFSDCMS